MNIMKLMKNAHNIEKMMKEAQKDLEQTFVTGEAGAGAVTVKMNAKHTIQSLHIDDETHNGPKEIEIELIMGAINHAASQIEEITKSKIMNASDLLGSALDGKDDKE